MDKSQVLTKALGPGEHVQVFCTSLTRIKCEIFWFPL